MKPSFLLLLVLALSACSPDRASVQTLKDEGYLALRRGDLRAASSLAARGLEHARKSRASAWERQFQVLSAEVLVEEMRGAEALAVLETVTPPVDTADPLDARAAMTRGYAQCLVGGGDEALRHADVDLQWAARLAALAQSPEIGAEVVLRQGVCAILRGKVADAETRLRAAVALARQQGLPFLEARAVGSIGYLKARNRQFDAGALWLTKALDLTSSLGADVQSVRLLANLGWCYYELGDYERALTFLSRADAQAQVRGQTGARLIALQNAGRAHYHLGDLDKAEESYRAALSLAEALDNRALVAELQSNMALIALGRERYDDAEAAVHEALRINTLLQQEAHQQYTRVVEGLIRTARGDYEGAESLYRAVLASPRSDTLIRWTSRAALADLAVKTQRQSEAEAEYRKAFALMEASYAELHEAEHRISFFSSLDQFHDDYVDFLVATGKERQALEVADRSRARQLRELLASESAPTKVMAEGRLVPARGSGDVILFYSVGRFRSFLWVLAPRGVQFRELPGEAEIRQHVEAHQRRVLQARDPLEEESPDAGWLYQTLVAPVAGSIPPGSRAVFVPDGPLYQLNPETLVVPSPKPHYWIEDVTLLTAPSVSVLTAAKGAPARSASGRSPRGDERRDGEGFILLFGDPLPTGEEFPRLAQAERELARIADQFAPEERTLFAGAHAVPSAYSASEPRRFTFVHFAAHAQASREVPLDSAVILTAEKESGKLYAREIVNVPLQAELVTLSACRTAGSRTFAGEGLVGLGWAFLSAGAENVIAGLWNVEDASTAELMADLYREVRQGQSPAESLRQAKLRLLRSQTAYRKPFYWAPFMIYTRSAGSRPVGRRAAARP